MTIRILDSVAPVSPQVARSHGYTAIMRYLAGNSALTAKEVSTYTAAKFGIGSLWELDPNAVANGENQGAKDAQAALAAAKALKQPKGTAIYFACDMDPAGLPGGPAGAIPYYRAVANAVRAAGYLAGAYIGAAAANDLLKAGVTDRIMIPNARSWSDGQTPKREDIHQGYPEVVLAGESYDPDTADGATSGLWNGDGHWPKLAPQPQPTPTPTPTPKPQPKPNGGFCKVKMPILKRGDRGHDVLSLQGALKSNHRLPGLYRCRGIFDLKTERAVNAVLKDHNHPETGQTNEAFWNILFSKGA